MDELRKTETQINEQRLNQKLNSIPPYARQVSEAVLGLAAAVEMILNKRDVLVLNEVETVCLEIFEAARLALKNDERNLQ